MASTVTDTTTIELDRATPPPKEGAGASYIVALDYTRKRVRRLLPHIVVLAALTVLTIAATWPLFPQMGGFVIDLNNPQYSVWLLAWQARALATNPLDIFDTNIMYPFEGTLAFDELAFTEALFAAPVLWVTGNPVLSHNLVLFSAFVIAGYGAWLLVRELTGNAWAAFVAACANAFSFYMLNHLPHITLSSAQWIPFVLLAAYKSLWTHKWRWTLALAGFFALQALSGHYLAFYTALLLALFFAYYLLVQRNLFSRRLLGRLAASFIGAAAVIAPIGVPYALIQGSQGFKRNLFEVERFSNTLSSFLAVFRGSPRLRELLAPFADNGPWAVERSAYPGLAVVILGAIGTVSARRHSRKVALREPETESHERNLGKHAIFFAALTLLTALLSLGPYLQLTFNTDQYNPDAIQRVIPLPYLPLHDWVPGFQTMRVVARIGVLTALGLSVLSGFCAFFVLRLFSARLRGWSLARYALAALAVAMSLVPVAESWSAPVGMEPVGTRGAVPPVYRWLAAQPRTVILEYPMTHFRRGETSVVMANTYQYYSVYHWQDTINGSAAIRPFAYSALVLETETCFPCPRSLDALAAMGVQYIIVHLENLSAPQRTDFLWRSTNPAGKVVDSFQLAQDFGADQVYQIPGTRDVTRLRELIPPGASLLLGDVGADPERQAGALVYGGYMAALGNLLRANPQWSADVRVSYGQPVNQATSDTRTDYAILWATQNPSGFGLTPGERIWSNEFVTLYKRSGAP